MSSSYTLIKGRAIQLSIGLTFILVFLAAIGRFFLAPKDNSRCQSSLQEGWWQKPGTQWQPSGCMMHTYKAAEIATCLSHSHILYVGDSIAREQFFSFAKIIRPDIETEGPRHVDRRYQFNDHGLTFEFWWDPYLNSTRTEDLLKTTHPASQPSLLVVGSGMWYLRYLEDSYLEDWQVAIDRVFDAVQRSGRVADAVVISPVEVPQFDLLSPERVRTMSIDKVQAMNAYLKYREQDIQPLTPLAIPFAWNSMTDGMSEMTEDGLHYTNPITATQAQLILNYRCNDQLPKHFPMASTCCYHYPIPKWFQNIFFLLFLFWAPLGLYFATSEKVYLIRNYFPSEAVLNAVFAFGMGVVYMYFGDRTQIFGKAQKLFDPWVFSLLMFIAATAGALTLKAKKEGDQGFLNRDQTDEWKGWMQVIILIYHFVGASSVSGIYNPVRILVAAYLFQTGYGHFFFFYKKGDFGYARVLNVMVRLNLLTFVLQYVMDTDYLSYYFTPLVSFWFIVIWVTMYIGNGSNKVPYVILGKIFLAGVFTTVVIHAPGVLEDVFALLNTMFNIKWNAGEWRFRLQLDAYIIYIGMLFAYGSIKFQEHKLNEHPLWPKAKIGAILASAVALVGYFVFELSLPDKFTYNRIHPYISWIPIVAFIILRNATVRLRNTSSKFHIFFGRISLETFIGQFHMWLAGDTKGLLVVVTHPRAAAGLGWWFNLVVSSALFIFVCYHVSAATGTLTRWICTWVISPTPAAPATRAGGQYQAVPLLPTNAAKDSTADAPLPPSGTSSSADSPATTHTEHVAAEETWNEEGTEIEKPSLTNRFVSFLKDGRVKSVLFLVLVGLANNLCE